MKKTGAQILIDALIRENVKVLFGYPGGVVIPIFDVIYETKEFTFVLTRHEQAAAHAADGYARATGEVGVCLATSGPGATNLITGIATAYLDSIPMVAITGQVATPLLGTDAFQEADVVGISRPITKHNFLVRSVKELPEIIRKAFYIASTGRPGPVLVDIPVDVSRAVLDDYQYPETVSIRSYNPVVECDIAQIDKAVELLSGSKKPLIFAGGGVNHAGAYEELRIFAEKTNIPVTTSLMGMGTFPAEHELFIGMPGMHGAKTANYSIQEADLILSIGVRFDDRVTGFVANFAPNASIVHIDIDPVTISKIVKVDVPVVADAKTALRLLIEKSSARPKNEWNTKVSGWKGEKLYTYTSSESVIKPQMVIEELYKFTGGNAVVATEVGQHQMWTAQYFRCNAPRTLLTSGGLGTMGFGLPAAMGAAMGIDGKPVMVIGGDGSIQMNIQELATLSINNIPVKIIILNNTFLGMVRQWQELFYDHRYSSTCMRGGFLCSSCVGIGACKKQYVPDFVAVAKGYNIAAFRAETPQQVLQVIKDGFAVNGPALMEFIVSPEENVFPMVPAGKSLDDILEG
ncbi:MAG: biosynthetic-type acetolactate synthase large subunit [Chitinispirillaceae bacterium]|nr:biosynthetic-type acetolactate synthase large subunit [Chitinispirillaceae bacterium]